MRAPAHVLTVLALVAAATAGWIGCGSDEPTSEPAPLPQRDAGGEYDNLATIEVTPASAELVGGDVNQSQAFTATGRFKDGSTRDLSSVVSWKVAVPNLLVMNGATATPTGARGGDTTLTASVGPAAGTANVRVKWVKTVLAPGADAAAKAKFDNAAVDGALAPTLAYPLADALVPPNLPPMEIQWKPAAGTTVFDVSFASATIDLHVITPCNAIGATGGCGLALDKTTWSSVTSTLAGEDPADVVVRGAGATPGKIGASAKSAIQLAKDDIKGGLYYFNTLAVGTTKPGIYRYDFATAQVGPFYTAGQCAGCHALSKDGTKMLAPICTDARGCGRPMQLAVVDVATKQVVTPAYPVGDSDTQTWTPDNKFYVTTPTCATISPTPPGACATNANGVMSLIDAATNAKVGNVPAGAGAMYPSFSNDGKKLVYARGGSFKGPLGIQRSSLFLLDFDASQSSPAWGVEKALLTAGAADYENNYHPSFSPDDQWVLFTRSNCQAGDDPNVADINANVCDSYNDYTAKTFVIPAAGGTPVEMKRANGEGRNTVSWPKWAPFKSTYKGGDVFWYTVSSVRDYGFRALHTRAGANPAGGVQQLWLVGFDPKKAQAGADPSFAPVWLPFQDVTSSNHIGQWTEAIIGPVK